MQRQAILVLLDTMQAQLTAVRSLVEMGALEGTTASRSVKIPLPDDGRVLSDDEDGRLDDLFAVPPELRQAADGLLHDLLSGKPAGAKEPST